MISNLSLKVLIAGLDDWVPLAAMEGLARKLGTPQNELGQAILDSIRELAESHLVELGEVSDGGFFTWHESTDSALARIAEARKVLDPNDWGFFCWTSNTVAGDTLARALRCSSDGA
jgi:hypothetical protein